MKGLERIRAGLCQDFLSNQGLGCYSESHYNQSLIYLESAQHFIVGTMVHRCAALHTGFLQEHFLKSILCFVLMNLLSVYLDKGDIKGITVRHIAVPCKK